MPGKRTPSKGRRINPHFWVFCEGETEEAYISLLRTTFRIPIEIITKVSGNSITQRKIKSFKVGKFIHPKDKDFLIYDADVSSQVDKLRNIKADLILTNPSIELWFLLHYKNQQAEITTEDCIRQLCNLKHSAYKKGMIDRALEHKLTENCQVACERAEMLEYPNNPSSNFNLFIRELEKALANKDIA